MGGTLTDGMIAFNIEDSTFVKSEKSGQKLQNTCVRSTWLFMDGVFPVMKARFGNVDVEISIDNTEWKLNTIIFPDNTVLLEEG